MNRSMTRHALVLVSAAFMLSLCFAGLSLPARNASADTWSIIGIQVDRPAYAGTSEYVSIIVMANGGPAGDVGGNYTVLELKASGKNTTGFDYTPKAPSNEDGYFKINVTMPGEGDQTLTITVNVTSKSADLKAETYNTFDFTIRVVQPIVLKAVVYNTGSVEAKNVTANFFADGALIHSIEFNVSAGKSRELSYNWTFSSIRRGQHEITVTVDDPQSIVEFSDGNNVLSLTIYVGEQGNPGGAVLTIILIIIIVIFVLTYLQKPVKRTKKF
jgi:hypothetical protein